MGLKMTATNPTIYDIAAKARVSHATVSLALRPPPNGRSRMQPSTRRHILKTAQRLGYRPNILARGLKCGRTYNVGMYINRADYLNLTLPSWHAVVLAAQTQLWKHGYHLSFSYFERGQGTGFLEFLTPGRFVDGILVQGRNLSSREISAIRKSGMPTVSLYEKIDGFWSLTVDEYGAGQAAAEYLWECGHRRVAIIAPRHGVERWDGRIHGFLKRAAEIGLEVPKAATTMVERATGMGSERIVGRRLFRGLLKRAPAIRCVYVPSDYYAFGVLDVMDEHRLRVGKDVSLLSYDNLEGKGHGPWKSPRLTSYDPPHDLMGIRAADLLAGQAGAGGERHFVFQPRRMDRNSVVRFNRR